jgi:pimeloyl-ACP methyl ester carboxylesterase
MPYATVDDVRLHYNDQGSGPPLLFVHGLGSSSRDWAAQARYFTEHYRVLRVDLRGHGRSERGRRPYHIAQFARDIAVLLRKLGIAPVHVAGLSMGGMVALELGAGASQLVRSLVVVNSTVDMRLHSWHDVWFYASRRLAVQALGMRRVGRLLARKLFVKPSQEELRRKFVRRWSQNDKQAYLWSVDAIMRWSVADRLDRITAPALLVSSDEDYTPAATKNRSAARMPNAELSVVKDARHALPAEKPDVFNELVDDFLARVSREEEGERSRPRPSDEMRRGVA